MTTEINVNPLNKLPITTGNLQPPVIITGLENDVEYTVTLVTHLRNGFTMTETRKLRPSQFAIAGITPDQIVAMSTAEIVALGTDISVLTSSSLGALSSAQLHAITTAQAASFNSTAISSLSGSGFAGLTTDNLGAISTSALQGMTAEQVDTLDADDIVALGSGIANIPSGAMASLDSSQVNALTTSQIAAFDRYDIAALSSSAIVGLTSDQIAALNGLAFDEFTLADLDQLSFGAIAGITPEQIDTLNTDDIQALGTDIANLSTAAMASLDSAQVYALTPAQLAAFDVADISALTSDAVSGLTSAQVASLTTDAFNALTTAGLAGLTFDAVAGITSAQVGTLDAADIVALGADIANLSSAAMASLSSTQISVLQNAQIAAFGTEDYAALNITGVTTTAMNNLMSSVVTAKAQDDINSKTELQALSDAAAYVMTIAALTNSTTLSSQLSTMSTFKSHLILLGVTGVTDQNMKAIWVAVRDSDNSGSAVDTLVKLQAITDAANDSSIVTPSATTRTYIENATPLLINDDLVLTDVDSSLLVGATVTISNGYTTGDLLDFTTANGITGSFDTNTHTLTLTGTATVAHYQTALRSVTYFSSSDHPTVTSATRTISWQVNDGTTAGVTDLCDIATSTISITAVNEAPTLDNPLVDQTGAYGTAFTYVVPANSFSDIDSTLTYSATLESGAALPSWLTFTPNTKTFSGTPVDTTDLSIKVIASDGTLTADDTFGIAIQPGIISIAVTSATGAQNNFLNVGDTVTSTVTFSEAVTVTGSPLLALDVGGTTVQASFNNGSGTSALTFNYTILAGQTDTDGISFGANALSLNGATIADTDGNTAVVASSMVVANSSYKVDTVSPTIATVTPSWGSELNSSESGSNGTISVVTTGVENNQTVTATINSVQYTGTVSSNAATITVPTADLVALTSGNTYTISVSVSDLAGNSTTNSSTAFTVNFAPVYGQPLGGGYYAGNIIDGGVIYRLIVAPKATGEYSNIGWGPYGIDAPVATQTLTNGVAASNAMNSSDYPAAFYCRGLNIAGFTDWYLPARDELEVLYRNFKPWPFANYVSVRPATGFGGDGLGYGTNTNSYPVGAAYSIDYPAQTGIAIFKDYTGTEAFVENRYWSSTENDTNKAWYQDFRSPQYTEYKNVSSGMHVSLGMYVRAVRRVVYPITIPDQPTAILATAGGDSTSIIITFTAPYSGNSPITGYTVTVYTNGTPTGITAAGSASPITVSGLAKGITYTFTVKATNSIGTSLESVSSNAITPVTPVYGQPLGGGYYAGNIIDGGVTYKLIVAPNASGANGGIGMQWGPYGIDAPVATQTLTNGVAASNAMNSSDYPAAFYCRGLNIAGFTDWYLPARDELEVLYRNFKPDANANDGSARSATGFGGDGLGYGTNANSYPVGAAYTSGSPAQTGIAIFRTSGTESFYDGDFWSSTEFNTNYAWYQNFKYGRQLYRYKDTRFGGYVRAVRRVESPITIPDQPTVIVATAGDSSAVITFTSSYDGNSPITGYTVTAYTNGTPAGITAAASASPITVSGLANGITYTFTVKATNSIGTSLESVSSNAITPVTIPATLVYGQPFGGGYYAGNIIDGGVTYKLIVAPTASGTTGGLFKTSNTAAPAATQTLTNGIAASNAMNSSEYPAAYFCKGLNIAGFTDWYLPARDELEVLYRNLRPTGDSNYVDIRAATGFGGDGLGYGTNANSYPVGAAYTSGSPAQTGIAIFKTNGTEAFVANSYISSTENDTLYVWNQNFRYGNQTRGSKVGLGNIRAVRRMFG